MTDLDTLARAATQELLERTVPDVRGRVRRAAAHPRPGVRRPSWSPSAAAVAARGRRLAAGRAAGPRRSSRRRSPEASPTARCWRCHVRRRWHREHGGPPSCGTVPEHLPDDAAVLRAVPVHRRRAPRWSTPTARATVVATGRCAPGPSVVLGHCPDDVCAGSCLAGRRAPWRHLDGDGVWLPDGRRSRRAEPGVARSASMSAAGAHRPGHPTVTRLAFAAADGVYVAGPATARTTGATWPGTPATPLQGPVSWSPDGDAPGLLRRPGPFQHR